MTCNVLVFWFLLLPFLLRWNRPMDVTGFVLSSHPAECNRGQTQRRIYQHHSWTSLSLALDHNEGTDSTSLCTMSRRSFVRASFLTFTVAANPGLSAAATETASFRQTTISSGHSPSSSSSFQESISGFIAGAALATTKTIVKFPLDTATVRLQVPTNEPIKVQELSRLFHGSYNGVTLSLLSNIPGGAIFFAVKDAVKASLNESSLHLPKSISTTIAVGAACIPYWIVRNPSEVIKVRQQAATNGYGSGISAAKAIELARNEGAKDSRSSLLRTFYSGYWANVAYGFPADIIKFLAYEMLTDGRRNLAPAEAATTGALATAIAQLVTTPLDVVRNRLMTSQAQTTNDDKERYGDDEASYLNKLSTLAREEGIDGLFAGVAPRVCKAFLSGAIQFATYEETKQSISRLLLKPPS